MPEITYVVKQDDEIDFDTSNPRSLINIVPSFFRDHMRGLQMLHFEMGEGELELKAFTLPEGARDGFCAPDYQGKPDEESQRIKFAFWDEYDRAQREMRDMKIATILEEIATPAWFNKMCKNKYWVAWLIRIPAKYETAIRDLHLLSLREMRAIMTMPLVNERGQVNAKLMDVKFKIAQHIDTRAKGAVVQKIENKNLNLNVNANGQESEIQQIQTDMAEIDRKLAELRGRSQAALTPGGVTVDLMRDVSAHSVEPELVEAGTLEVHEQKEAGAGQDGSGPS